MKNIIKKLKCTKTVIAIAGAIILILSNLGIKLDNEIVTSTIEAICYILVLLGVMNDEGMETIEWDK